MGLNKESIGLDIVAGDVHVAGFVERQRIQKRHRVVAVIAAVHIDVVHVEVQQAIRLGDHGRDELGFTHFGTGRSDVVGGILDSDAAAQNVGDISQNMRLVGDCVAQVVAATEFFLRLQRDGFLFEDSQNRLKRNCRAACGIVDHVCDHCRCFWHLTSAVTG